MPDSAREMCEVSDVSAERYHADDFALPPSLTRSGIVTLLGSTPAEFASQHPRLSTFREALKRTSTDATDLGEVIHALVLGTGSKYVVADASDFAAKNGEPSKTWGAAEAAAFKRQCEAEGKIIIGRTRHAMAERLASRLLDACRTRFPDWDEGRSEQTVTWARRLNDGSQIRCRARIDRLLPSVIVDVKSTALSLSDEEVGKRIALDGLDVQHVWYRDGIARSTGREMPFIFPFVRTVPPYTIRFVNLAAKWPLGLTRERVDTAAHVFGECLASGVWPDEPIECQPEPPEWVANRWMAAQLAALTESAER